MTNMLDLRLTELTLKGMIFSIVKPCGSSESTNISGGRYHCHLQSERVSQAQKWQNASTKPGIDHKVKPTMTSPVTRMSPKPSWVCTPMQNNNSRNILYKRFRT
jgi:hypothetical protein